MRRKVWVENGGKRKEVRRRLEIMRSFVSWRRKEKGIKFKWIVLKYFYRDCKW